MMAMDDCCMYYNAKPWGNVLIVAFYLRSGPYSQQLKDPWYSRDPRQTC